MSATPIGFAGTHIDELVRVLAEASDGLAARTHDWATTLAARFQRGNRLLVAGNGGSAAEAQHLTAELVGRFRQERAGLPAIALHADTSSLTAIGNDLGYDQVFARGIEAFARPRDVVLLLTTSGRSPNLLAAAVAARRHAASVWVMTGRVPNPLAELADHVLAVDSADGCVVQEVHLVAVHLLAAAVDQVMASPAVDHVRIGAVSA
jgi:phosphoheptose isomerase